LRSPRFAVLVAAATATALLAALAWQRAPVPPAQTALADAGAGIAGRDVPLTKAEQRARAENLVRSLTAGARVVDVFNSPTGLTGIVLDGGQGRFIAWLPDAHDVLIVGAVFDRDGANVTLAETIARGLAAAAPEAPDQNSGPAPQVAVAWRALERAAGFEEGSAGPRVIAFTDPQCGYCAELWRRLRAPLASGRLRVRWVPVGVVAPDSAARAAALLRDPRPASRLGAHERGPPPAADAAAAEAIAANNALLELVTRGRIATPVLAVRDERGAPQFVVGLPPDLDAWLQRAR
jgi:thiol:disulfide interchange protein DsbG